MNTEDAYPKLKKIRSLLVGAGIITALTMSGAANAAAVKLSAYNADPSLSTVSGISSGGYMAVQMHVAYSASFKTGAAIFAGGPFYCTQGSVSTAQGACMNALPSGPDTATSISTTNSYASAGSIDATSNLTSTKVYMWSGTSDTIVKQAVMNALKTYYLTWVPSANIIYDNTHAAGHGWISPDATAACSAQADPYINNCSTDAEQTFLTQMYGTLNAKNTGTLSGSFIEFDQTEFFDDKNPAAHSIANSGWMYVPSSCAAKKACKVQIAYHGCVQYYGKVGDVFIKKSGLNEWADTNNIIVVYPQTIASNSNPSNPNGCWDWWAYDDPNFAKKTGRQMLMSKRILDRITSGFVSNSANPAPTGLTTGTVTYNSVALSWNASTGASGYNAYRSDSTGGARTKVNSTLIAGTSTTASGLSQNTTYYFVVKAQDSGGLETVDSNQVSASTPSAPLGSVAAPTLVVGSPTSTTVPLSWGAVTGATGYNIYYSTSASGVHTQANANAVTGTSYTVSGLASSTAYTFWGRTLDSSSLESADSASVSGTTAAPPFCKLWTSSNYAHVQAARATQNASSHAIAVGSGNDMGLNNTYTNTTLREAPSGYFTIASDCNAAINYPTGVTVGTVTNNSVALSWTGVTGSSGYNVYYSTTRTGAQTRANGSTLITGTTYTTTGLQSNTTYYLQVTSQNGSGTESQLSDQVSATTSTNALAAPTGLTVGTVTASSVALSWSASAGASGYNAYTSDKSGGILTQANGTGITTTSYTVTQLAGSTTYFFKVKAYDASNNISAASNEVSTTTTADAAPNAPTALAIAAGTTDTSIPVTFTASTSSNLKGSNMYYSKTSGGPYTLANSTPISGTSYTYTGLTSSTTYYFVVRAQNLSGTESANSTQVSGATLSAKPAQPTNVAVAAGTTDTTVPLSWTASTGPNLSGYNVYYGTAAGGPYNKSNASLLGTGTTYTATKLNAATSYFFMVRAQNTSAVESVNSNEVAAKTLPATYCKVWFAANYNHVHATPARATDSLGNAIAIGSGTNMGLDSLGVSSYLKEKPQGYFTYSATVITCP
jgi:poly(3-hydroxybutyrate) depolymerase